MQVLNWLLLSKQKSFKSTTTQQHEEFYLATNSCDARKNLIYLAINISLFFLMAILI